MQICAYLRRYLFRIVHVLWTARGCVGVVSFHCLLRSGTEFRHHLPVVLRIHTLLGGRVSGEQRGGAAEIPSRIGADRGNEPQLRVHGWD
jgi:hypothetical protein